MVLRLAPRTILYSPAVDVKQNAIPARHDDATVVSPPAMGRDNSMPMLRMVVVAVVETRSVPG